MLTSLANTNFVKETSKRKFWNAKLNAGFA